MKPLSFSAPHEPAWILVQEIAEHMPTKNWVLVGGLMVQAHALASGISVLRPTDDVDMLLDVATESMGYFGAALRTLGFRESTSNTTVNFHRFTRELDVVDVLVAQPARWNRMPVFKPSGAAQALRHSVAVVVFLPSGPSAETGVSRFIVRIPTALSALLLKAAAYESDGRAKERHLFDAAVLLACVETADLTPEGLSKSETKRIRAVVDALADPLADFRFLLESHIVQRVDTALKALR